MATLICPHCGMANRAGSNFCNNCGAHLRAEEPPLPPDVESAGEAHAAPEAHHPGGHDASAADEADASAEWLAEQPWLRTGNEDDVQEHEEHDAKSSLPYPGSGRLVTGVQGLLPPLNLSSDGVTASPLAPAPSPFTGDDADAVQRLMGRTPTPAAAGMPAIPDTGAASARKALRLPWLFWLLGLVLLLPLLFRISGPVGAPRAWPGVTAAYLTVEDVARNSTVLAYWAYDPAVAGELDQVALPIMRHLINREAQIAVVSTVPGGPATARRVTAAAFYGNEPRSEGVNFSAERLQIADRMLLQNVYLPGGAAALPLVGQDIMAAVGGADNLSAPERVLPAEKPALVVLFAAQAEDVQSWLELVQPQFHADVAVIAATGAGADPMLRPYLDSGQLNGLVSGFDGGYAYADLLNRSRLPDEVQRLRTRLVTQNWGQIALLGVILLSNLAVLLGGRRES